MPSSPASASGLEAAAREDALVGVVHVPVAPVRARRVHVERIGVLHQELLRAHEAEARPRLVAVLPLDLVDRQRQLAVGRDDALGDVGEDLLGGRPHRELALGAVLEAEHVRAHHVPAARRAPQLGGLEDRRDDLLRARAVHLLADDLLDLLQRAHAERQVGVETARNLAHQARAHEQAVRINFRVLRVLPQRLNQRLCPFHGCIVYQISIGRVSWNLYRGRGPPSRRLEILDRSLRSLR